MPDPPADFIEIDAEENIDRKLRRESKRVTRYLDSLTSHPTLKSCPEIEIFLKEKVLPEKEEEKASLFSKISSLFTSKSSSAFIRDIDDFFELEQIYATKYEQLIRQLNEAHTEVVECLKRLAGQHGHIGACLSMPVDGVSKRGKKMIHIHAQMTSYFKNFQFWMELAISSSQVTLGQAAGFYWAYTCNELEMFQRRKDLLIEYQEANATLGKSVGQKREVAAKKQKEVERKLEECSDTARDEIRWFVKKRSKDLLSTVQEYAAERSKYEHKILLAIQDSLEELRKAPE
ncbi:hypothetical protein QYM36_009759 [Artemia franciscana]|nr:hypothetical protein QYM36_009759 [Artemia franciscana]